MLMANDLHFSYNAGDQQQQILRGANYACLLVKPWLLLDPLGLAKVPFACVGLARQTAVRHVIVVRRRTDNAEEQKRDRHGGGSTLALFFKRSIC